VSQWLALLPVCASALLIDALLGEPKRWHPVVGFGAIATWLEVRLNRFAESGNVWRGCLALLLAILPLMIASILLTVLLPGWLLLPLEILALWLCLSLRGLREHGLAVAAALHQADLALARQQVGMIVSRRTDALDADDVARAATESMLENGADAVFASLFWYLVAGLPGVVLHRAVNTLDAMWGYRNERFLSFGRCAARFDDLLNWLPARLTALGYALASAPEGRTVQALRCWRQQAPAWDSPNAGPVMAAGAGALGVELGGPAVYGETVHERGLLGGGARPSADSIVAAIDLVSRGLLVWLVAGLVALTTAWLSLAT
jgi:adenosylcobinamide-phosphate synthase